MVLIQFVLLLSMLMMVLKLLLLFFIIPGGKNIILRCFLNQFRQHPLDYIEGLEYTIKDCLQKAGKDIAANVKAISVDTTGSTPVAVDKTGTPLALLPDLKKS